MNLSSTAQHPLRIPEACDWRLVLRRMSQEDKGVDNLGQWTKDDNTTHKKKNEVDSINDE